MFDGGFAFSALFGRIGMHGKLNSRNFLLNALGGCEDHKSCSSGPCFLPREEAQRNPIIRIPTVVGGSSSGPLADVRRTEGGIPEPSLAPANANTVSIAEHGPRRHTFTLTQSLTTFLQYETGVYHTSAGGTFSAIGVVGAVKPH